jgi:hypothetical protein
MRDEKHRDVGRLLRQNRKSQKGKGEELDPGLRRDDEVGAK